jgi:hypothetical protein
MLVALRTDGEKRGQFGSILKVDSTGFADGVGGRRGAGRRGGDYNCLSMERMGLPLWSWKRQQEVQTWVGKSGG